MSQKFYICEGCMYSDGIKIATIQFVNIDVDANHGKLVARKLKPIDMSAKEMYDYLQQKKVLIVIDNIEISGYISSCAVVQLSSLAEVCMEGSVKYF
jgi:hypothetical protein